MSKSDQQLSMWAKTPIVHVAVALKGAKFEPTSQPAWRPGDVKPGQRVTMVVEGYIDGKVTEDDTEAGRVAFVGVSLERAYVIVDEALAEALLDSGAEATRDALRERMGVVPNDDAIAS